MRTCAFQGILSSYRHSTVRQVSFVRTGQPGVEVSSSFQGASGSAGPASRPRQLSISWINTFRCLCCILSAQSVLRMAPTPLIVNQSSSNASLSQGERSPRSDFDNPANEQLGPIRGNDPFPFTDPSHWGILESARRPTILLSICGSVRMERRFTLRKCPSPGQECEGRQDGAAPAPS